MRKVVVRQAKPNVNCAAEQRLVSLLATGLERLLQKERASSAEDVDFSGEQSVTTTCPNGGGEEMRT